LLGFTRLCEEHLEEGKEANCQHLRRDNQALNSIVMSEHSNMPSFIYAVKVERSLNSTAAYLGSSGRPAQALCLGSVCCHDRAPCTRGGAEGQRSPELLPHHSIKHARRRCTSSRSRERACRQCMRFCMCWLKSRACASSDKA